MMKYLTTCLALILAALLAAGCLESESSTRAGEPDAPVTDSGSDQGLPDTADDRGTEPDGHKQDVPETDLNPDARTDLPEDVPEDVPGDLPGDIPEDLPPDQPPPPPMTCPEALNCLQGCEGDQWCEDDCFMASEPDAQEMLSDMRDCMESRCEGLDPSEEPEDFDFCLTVRCEEELFTCLEMPHPPHDQPCSWIGECIDTMSELELCSGNQGGCMEDCMAQGSPEGRESFSELLDCVWTRCEGLDPSEDPENFELCLTVRCEEELLTCVEMPPPPHDQPCAWIGECIGTMAELELCSINEEGCVEDCMAQGSPEGRETFSELLDCVQERCPEEFEAGDMERLPECAELHCGAIVAVCFGEEPLTGCWAAANCIFQQGCGFSDDQCVEGCAGLASAEGNLQEELFQDIVACGEEHCDEAGMEDVWGCLMESCTGQTLSCVAGREIGQGEGDCRELMMCMMGCEDGEQECQMDCEEEASPEALGQMMAFFVCVDESCGEIEDEEERGRCMFSECFEEYDGCLRIEGPCRELLICMNTCEGEGCDEECGREAPPECHECMSRVQLECAAEVCPAAMDLWECMEEHECGSDQDCIARHCRDEAMETYPCLEEHGEEVEQACADSHVECFFGEAPGEPPGGCEEILTCAVDCGEDVECQAACLDQGDREARRQFTALAECALDSCPLNLPPEEVQACLVRECPEQLAGCVGGLPGLCDDYEACKRGCEGDEECHEACLEQASPDCRNCMDQAELGCAELICPVEFGAYIACLVEHACVTDECIREHCSDQSNTMDECVAENEEEVGERCEELFVPCFGD